MKCNYIASIINYCSNDFRFFRAVVKEALKFSRVYIVAADHFFDGSEENIKLLDFSFSLFPECKSVIYPFVPGKFNSIHLWHSFSRLVGFELLDKDIEYVLFLDADEVVDGSRFLEWLSKGEYQKFNVLKLANYWYFREERFQALTFEDSIVFARKKKLSKKNILHENERDAIFELMEAPKIRGVLGLDLQPMVHHYSWVRTKKEMLKKVKSWGHREDKNWEALIEKEFSGEFSGKDFLHGYSYKEVVPFAPVAQLDRVPGYEPGG